MFILSNIGARLKEARRRLGLSQIDLAEAGGVSRSAQINYESQITVPDTNYLERIQSTKVDLPFVLGGHRLVELLSPANNEQSVDWPLVQQAYDDVAFFCERFAPNCPSSYRWELIAELYRINKDKLKSPNSSDRVMRQQEVQKLWDKQF